ncbi:MAG: hypothetical protein ACLU3I_05350 [Acutalibacteraceae bacterium]
MRLFLQYLRGKAGKIVAFFLFAVIFIVSFALYHLPLAAVWYPSVLCVILGLAVLLLDFRRVKARHRDAAADSLPAAHASRDAPGSAHRPGGGLPRAGAGAVARSSRRSRRA